MREVGFSYQNAPFKGHVTMWGINGVNYKDCDFQTLNTTAAEQLGFGIYTYDAGFSVIRISMNGFLWGELANGNNYDNNLGNFVEGDYFNNATSFNYYYKPNTPNDPIYYSTSTINKIIPLLVNECIINIGFGMGNSPITISEIQGKKGQFYASQTAYASLLYTYEQLIDDRNTNTLVQSITQTWSDNAWELRTELLSRAPYLSENCIERSDCTRRIAASDDT